MRHDIITPSHVMKRLTYSNTSPHIHTKSNVMTLFCLKIQDVTFRSRKSCQYREYVDNSTVALIKIGFYRAPFYRAFLSFISFNFYISFYPAFRKTICLYKLYYHKVWRQNAN